MSFVKCFQTKEEGINFLYPNGHDPILMQNRATLAATKKLVDEWNSVREKYFYVFQFNFLDH